ncbi:Arginine utilization protein RocB [Clostridiaceae bacterium JG1575]|nr:Arginine utilization protein RocB [Clostridiaceae bacterium JG1575]
MIDLSARIEELALTLTNVRSVVDTKGEVAVAEKAYDLFAKMPYFKEHPERLKKVFLPEDPLGRFAVLAWATGEKEASSQAVLTIGHLDTVGVSDYGALEPLATSPQELTEALRSYKLPGAAQKDLDSGDYLFGRGLFDMKTGDAILMALLEDFCQKRSERKGHFLVGLVPDEEGNSRGMLALVPEFARLKKEEHLDFLALLDTDYMTESEPLAPERTIFVGTVGKIMPSFYAVGKETHVGEAFNGLDPNEIIAELLGEINCNPHYCDEACGEVTLPPISLKMRDLKPEYSVQTARASHVYFNVATHKRTPSDVLAQMKQAGEAVFARVLDRWHARFCLYRERIGRAPLPCPYQPRVLTYEELLARVLKENGEGFRNLLEETAQRLALRDDLDERDKALELVAFLHNQWSDRDPVLIVYLTPPYYPHIHVDEATPEGARLFDAVAQAVEETPSKNPVVYRKFFPYISDLSYGAAPKEPQVIHDLKSNMPGFGILYRLPLQEMQELNLPVLDIGPFGKDAHQFTERIEKQHAFHTAPELTGRTIAHLLGNPL